MSDRHAIDDAGLGALFEALQREGTRILAPSAASSSAKHAVFPRVERILGFRGAGRDVEIEDPPPPVQPTLVFGVRPCEARAFSALAAVFDWDTPDAFFDARRAATTIVSVACTDGADEACFCTSVGGGPGDGQGSDALLRPLANGGYAVEALSEKGRALFARAASLRQLGAAEGLRPLVEVKPAFDRDAVTRALGARFDDDALWSEQSRRCLGCGACAFVCPACSCFDVQDERGRDGAGRRLRCWDSCALRPFTLHASGHNPRERQWQRWRQRVYHKFAYMPDRLGTLGCVGCGKCSRACPVDMSLKEHLVALAGGC